MLKTAQEVEVWIPDGLQKKIKELTNHRGMHTFKGREGDLIVAAAILGYDKLKTMTPEQIIAVLEEAIFHDR